MKRHALIVAVALLAGCAFTAPKGKYRLTPDETKTTPYGAYSQVRTGEGRFVGELLAIDTLAVYLQMQQGPYCIPLGYIEKISIAQYYGNVGEMTALYFAGAVATPFMHGIWFIFSAPVWLVTGAGTAAFSPGAESWSASGVFSSKPIPWDEVKPWARYPLGPPKALRENCPSALTPAVNEPLL